MRYKLLGGSGVRLSEVALGTMTFGEDWGWGASPDVSAKMLDLFADAGGNVIDTADVYTNGTSETPPRRVAQRAPRPVRARHQVHQPNRPG
jgi:aryl-alcohol dehydrogenase-like predicted oxidoreductase